MKRLISLPIRHSVFGIMVKHSIFSRLQHSRYAKYKGLLSLKDFKIIILVSKLNWIKKNIWKVSTSLYHDTGKPKNLVFLSWNFSCSFQMVSKVKKFLLGIFVWFDLVMTPPSKHNRKAFLTSTVSNEFDDFG